MAKIRAPREDDQQQIEKAYKILFDAVNSNHEIEGALWFSAMFKLMIGAFIKAGISYEEFSQEWDRIKLHTKKWYENDH